MKKTLVFLIITVFLAGLVPQSLAQDTSAMELLRAGLLGAGSGAVGGAASGAKGSDIWKGALAGAGVNIVGGALLDVMTKSNTQTQRQYYTAPQPQSYGSQTQAQTSSYYPRQNQQEYSYTEAYQAGYNTGYKEGYAEGLRDALREYYGN